MDLFSANQLMWAAFIVGNSTPVIFFILYYYQKITAELFKLYFLGVLVGLTWEIPFALAGKSFHLILIDWPINLPLVRNITYSFIDGLIFIVGIFLAKAFLKNKEFVDIKHIDIVFVPCVAFNNQLFRLGMGGGFYDRTFSKKTSTILIGIAYSFQFENISFQEEHDIKMDYVITQKEILK